MQLASLTQGTTEAQWAFDRVRLVSTTHSAGTRLEAHAHLNPTFTLVADGLLVEETVGRSFECGSGALLFKPAFVSHRNRYGADGARSLLIELRWSELAGPQLPPDPYRIRNPDALRIAARLSQWLSVEDAFEPARVVRDVENEVSDLVALSFVEAEHAGDPGRPRWLLDAYERLADMPREVPSVVGLAHEVGVHQDHLIRAFQAAYGDTPGVFARRRRAQVAAHLVCGSDQSLSAIAWETGYADQSHMTREFSRFIGTTPGALRRSGEGIR